MSGAYEATVKNADVAHAGEEPESSASVGISSLSSQANLPRFLFLVILFFFIDFLVLFVEIVVVEVVVIGWMEEVIERHSVRNCQGVGPEAAGACAVGAGVVEPGVAGGGVAGLLPGADG
jgi:hypothetical protein